ncbi:signal peptidase I [Sorangium atrum]|uniref:Signal peptidase I n=1 Tax=Sorangium atrum TaxID=2995308 RepID=A0ABT5C554_9BACT|nr:signal peptidase I [Sorangium aterium]MDC0681544.1 signal peptidase I [Sorangium aterium]
MGVQHKLAGAALQIVLVIGVQFAVLLTAFTELPAAHLLALPFIWYASAGFVYTRRLRRLSAEEELTRDPRPPILFLRSFGRDELSIKRPFFWLQLLCSFPWEQVRLWPALTFEEALANMLRRFGPVVALGNPVEKTQPEGASRLFAGSDWKKRVKDAARRSALVVILPDDRPALRWEMKRVASEPGLGRVLVVAPPLRVDEDWRDWNAQWRSLQDTFEFLPDIDERVAAVQFGQAGAARAIVARTPSPHHRLRAIERALRQHAAVRDTGRFRARMTWGLRRMLFYLFWYVSVPFGFALLTVWSLTPAHGQIHAATPIEVFVAEQTLPVVINVYSILFLVISILGNDLPLARAARIGVQVDPVRTHEPLRRLLRGNLLLAIAVPLILRAFVVEAFKIPSASMIPTLMVGDHIFVNKFTYGPLIPWTGQRLFPRLPPSRGDVMVFKFPENKEQDFIKRTIAIPGDTLEAINGRPIINGWLVPHCHVGPYHYEGRQAELFVEYLGDKSYFTLYEKNPDGMMCVESNDCTLGSTCRGGVCGDLQGPFKAAADEAWVMGDNRNNSHDSRSWRGGLGGGVPFENIKGRAMFVWMSFGPGGGIAQDRLFVNVMGDPTLPGSFVASLQTGLDECMRKRPPVTETTPP